MSPEQVVELARRTLETALWLGAPILLAATVVSLLVSIAQAVTSIQEPTVATIPRLAMVFLATFLLLPWIWRHLMSFTVQLFSDFRLYVN